MAEMTTVCVVEDDLTLSLMLRTWLAKKNFSVVSAINIKEAKRRLKKQLPDIVLSDMRLPDGDGISLLKWAKEIDPSLPYILMTSYAEIPAAVECIKNGAFDYVSKPLNTDELLVKIEQAIAQKNSNLPLVQLAKTNNEEEIDVEEETIHRDYIAGKSPLYKKLYEYVDLVAPTMMSVFILGESGVGKERIAQLIHEKSERCDGTFVAVDCGVLSKELAASEFFGHIKGSFTGAINNKKGFFLSADGGTVFLDEVGNLSTEVQVQLLRVLQEKKIRPVGSEKDMPVDVRIIAATNEKIDVNVPNPSFRLDLFHRLSEFVLYVPNLRECREDIPLYLNYFLEKSNLELNKNILGFDDETLLILKQYDWHGNLREMKNAVNRMVLVCKNQKITKDDLPENIK
ncbi:sigma-54-dependent Fis family transcriptional regulator [Bacteroidia bacterium]|nr:sigma-54-dependent Fis family transcriptional regulator [Bacteroidia bacterium]